MLTDPQAAPTAREFEVLADSIPQLAWMADASGSIFWYNRRWYEYTGTTIEDVYGWEWHKVHHPDHLERVAAKFRRSIQAGEPWEDTFPLRGTDGSYRWFLSRSLPIRNEAGQIERWFGTNTDVTEQLAAEESLRRSEQKYRALFESIDEGLCLIRVLYDAEDQPFDYAFLEANQAFERHTGLADPVGRTIRELIPDIDAHWIRIYGRVATTGTAERFEETSTALGRDFDVYAFRVGAAELRQVAVLFNDVTRRRRAEKQQEHLLREAESARVDADLERRRLAAVLEQLPVGVVVAEAPGGRILMLNAAVRRIWGAAPLSQEISEYKTDYVGYHLDTRRRYEAHEWPLARTLQHGEVVVNEVAEVERPNGSRIFVSLNSAPVRDGNGRIIGGVVTSQDVTEREELLAARAAALEAAVSARAAAEAANHAKAQFLAAMSHELRTPLNAIAGYVDLLDLGVHGPVADEQRAALERITVNQRHLLRLINDILQFAKLEAGHMSLEHTPIDIPDLFRSVEPLVAPLAAAKGVAYSARAAGVPQVVADQERVLQILLNLINNAVKFTPAGGWVLLSAEAEQAAVRFEVRDNGPGIPSDKQEAIFDPFMQVDRRLNNPQGGVGLGLAISRDLARAMGGDLTVQSIPGQGCTFTLTLPRDGIEGRGTDEA